MLSFGETIALLKVPSRLRLRCTTFSEKVAFFLDFGKEWAHCSQYKRYYFSPLHRSPLASIQKVLFFIPTPFFIVVNTKGIIVHPYTVLHCSQYKRYYFLPLHRSPYFPSGSLKSLSVLFNQNLHIIEFIIVLNYVFI